MDRKVHESRQKVDCERGERILRKKEIFVTLK